MHFNELQYCAGTTGKRELSIKSNKDNPDFILSILSVKRTRKALEAETRFISRLAQ
jgi:hypothetical protein